MTKELAPIILFTYNRLAHTNKTVEALQKNTLANKSMLFIYSDGNRNESDKQSVQEVRKYIKSITGFKTVTIIEQNKNLGLATSIILGVTDIINKYEKVIVLEDDIITSQNFLTFMNKALDFYKNYKNVWHISGFNYPISENNLTSTFLWRSMSCWGWATWDNKWKYFDKDTKKIIKSFNLKDIKKFNLDNTRNFWLQITLNDSKKLNTWAIFWYATIFSNNGLCLNPTISLTHNIGFDGSGTNCKKSTQDNVVFSSRTNYSFSKEIKENDIAVNKIKLYFLSQENKDLPKVENTFVDNMRSFFKQLEEIKLLNEKFIIYGTGKISDIIIDLMPENILYLVDTFESNQDKDKRGFKVKSPSSLKNTNFKILISSLGYTSEIIYLLVEKYFVKVDNIIVLNKHLK